MAISRRAETFVSGLLPARSPPWRPSPAANLAAPATPSAATIGTPAAPSTRSASASGRSSPVRFPIRDRDGKFPALFDDVLADAEIEVVVSGIRIPRMNAVMERWVQTCRHELLDRTPVWNHTHLLHALREFEHFYNGHRPHQALATARTLNPLPTPLTDPDQVARFDVRRRDRLGGILHEYEHPA